MRLPLCTLALCSVLASAGAAQVGHPPDASPYRDILKGHSVTALFGRMGGSGGKFGVGAQDGNVYGFRYDIRTAGAVQFGLTLAQGDLQRLIVDPFVQVARRTTGPVPQRVRFVDLSIQLNLTGGKSWHRLAPYTGVSAGVAFGDKTAADTSGYTFGNKFYFAPQIGTRFFLTDRLQLRADVRALFWRINYPTSFTLEPALDPGTTTEPHAVIIDDHLNEWTLSPWLEVGLGYSFSL